MTGAKNTVSWGKIPVVQEGSLSLPFGAVYGRAYHFQYGAVLGEMAFRQYQNACVPDAANLSKRLRFLSFQAYSLHTYPSITGTSFNCLR